MIDFIQNTIKRFLNKQNKKVDPAVVIEPVSGWQFIDFKELKEYKDLFLFLVWRDIKAIYAQTILGFSWAILQPLIQIVIFTIVFGKVAKVNTGEIPYILFSTVAIIPWTYMSQAMSLSSQSLVTGQNLLGKVYFPRLIFPTIPILAKLIDFGFSIIIVLAVCAYFRVMPTWNLILFPFLVVLMMSVSAGVGMWTSALAIRFRDVKHAMPFAIRMLMFTAPIVYSASSIPPQYRLIYSINPVVAIIEGFRSCMLGTALEWQFFWPGACTGILLLIFGAFYFKRMEKIFVDVI
jgi:lipopolysaccharide transport system permease protein